MDLVQQLGALGYDWNPAPIRHETYSFLNATVAGGLVYVAGQISVSKDGKVIAGKVGDDVDIDRACAAAEACAAAVLMAAGAVVDPLKILRVATMTVYVNVAPEFTQMPRVADAASKLLLRIFGGVGEHARAAIGVASLPMNAAVEIVATLELKP